MDHTIEPGCIVRCLNAYGAEIWIRKNATYTVRAMDFQGYALYLDSMMRPFSRERFELLYAADYFSYCMDDETGGTRGH